MTEWPSQTGPSEPAEEQHDAFKSNTVSAPLLRDPLIWILLIGGATTLVALTIAFSSESDGAEVIGTSALGVTSVLAGITGLLSSTRERVSLMWNLAAVVVGSSILIRLLIGWL